MDSVNNSTPNEKHELEDERPNGISQVVTDSSTISDSTASCRSFYCVRGISILSSAVQIDPELVDSVSIADIICSIEENNLSNYLSSMDNFTAKFMSKSLQYVRAFRFDPYPNGIGPLPPGDAYIDYGQHLRRYVDEFVVGPSDYNADEHIDPQGILYESTDEVYGLYGRLQYMCDYFKYYILESQFGFLPSGTTKCEETYMPVFSTINEGMKGELPIDIGFVSEEVVPEARCRSNYDELITSIRNECRVLMKKKWPLVRVKKIKSLKISYLDSSARDVLIKSLMEYYLLITDKFESMADLNFKYRDEFLSEKNVLPVPREVAEVVHEEIETGRPTSSYHDSKVDHFFCDLNRCVCLSNSESRSVIGIDHNMSIFTLSLIRKYVMEEVVNRMKRYILSLDADN
ncbi:MULTISPECIES: hypothetical protein [Candidatus Ichthyocystis]|uniref:Uncharacterized protein n=1 Tax=Candidatus Ichthyocystis hellenicum TaxID=1561003 RepID=A0A0S4M2E6_9BURK|nr:MULTISPECIES: hypothetical protein [Ichthyocystis]CUT17959.1 hypothetical protein Ark11_1146 [Candidatus Ichthyocystis hellenicum]